MNQQDYKTFADAWATAHEVMPAGKVLSQSAMRLCIEALNQYPIDALLLAIKKHVQYARYAPAPKDIIDLLELHNKRPSSDEAWANIPASEFDTVVWTQESAKAYEIAYNLIIDDEKIAARMAFKGAYDRLCNESALMQIPIKWSVCIGYDKNKIETVLQSAVLAGLITQDKANKYLPAPAETGLIAGLLTGKVTELPANSENLKKHWNELSQALKNGQARMEEERQQRVVDSENRRLEFERKREEIIKNAKAKISVEMH